MPHGICVCNGYFESDYIEEEKYGRRETANVCITRVMPETDEKYDQMFSKS